MKRENPALQRFASSLNVQDRLDLNDAFYGGRCEPLKTYCEAEGDEKIEYYDIVSLYPYIQQYSMFGISHPRILLQPDIDLDNMQSYFGVVKAKILAPDSLDIPVIPMKCQGKLIFALCHTCAELMATDPCTHTVEQRSWVTTCHTLELNLAISKGYKLIEVYEIWDYPPEKRCQYNKDDSSMSIFGSYITTFTRVKMEASGFPDHVITDKEKDAFIESVREREGISLLKSNTKHNAGMRYIAKILLNSLWGKLCQRSDRNTTKMFGEKDLGPMMRTLSNPAYEINDFHIGDKVVSLTYKEKKTHIPDCSHSNVLLAATITAAARCHLYSFMDVIPKQVIYLDTDSIHWIRKPNYPSLQSGSCLGMMKSELPANSFIRAIACCGAKSYSFALSTGEYTCRVKGFSLNHKNSQIINFESMKHMLRNDPNGYREITENAKIHRDRKHCLLYSAKETKRFTITNNKRVYFPDHSSKPYGYVD